VYDRRTGSDEIRTGHTGLLLENAFLFYETRGGSEFCQPTGVCLSGPMRGRNLERYPSWTLPWDTWRRMVPETRVLALPDEPLAYGIDGYAAYVASDRTGIFPLSRLDPRLAPKSFVVGVTVGGRSRCWPESLLARRGVVCDRIGDTPVAVCWDASGRWGTCFDRRVEGPTPLSLVPAGPGVVSDGHGTSWDLLGRGRTGPRAGVPLRVLPSVACYWFAWQAHHPDTEIAR
jgi:hypothetical protein